MGSKLSAKLDVGDDFGAGSLSIDDRKILRKVDKHILPIMFLTYFLQMIDKISINVSTGSHSNDVFDIAKKKRVCKCDGSSG